jgi:predicted RecA/RadA family phage recombinase
VNGFAVTGAENKDELRQALQSMLLSRLNGAAIRAVDLQDDAEVLVSGSYVVFGTVFSIDAVAKTAAGEMIDRAFVQGDSERELVAAVGKLAQQLTTAILEWKGPLTPRPAAAEPPPKAAVATPLPVKGTPADEPVRAAVPVPRKSPAQAWASQRLPEALNGIARGRTLADGEVEIFATGEQSVRYYRKGSELRLVAEVAFKPDEKVVGVDVADLDKDGVPEVYVTVLRGGSPASQVFVPDGDALKKIADNISYLLRGIAPDWKERKILAQNMQDFANSYGEVFELVKKGNDFAIRNPVRLPMFGNLYNFNVFPDGKGASLYAVYHPDGFLMVYSPKKKMLWKSSDKFGGSETCLRQGDGSPGMGCAVSVSQRLQVTREGNIIVPRNTGLAIAGASRSYSKNSVLELSWNGAALQEKWRTEQSPKYLADSCYDDQSRELLLLEVEQKDGTNERGSRVVARTVN